MLSKITYDYKLDWWDEQLNPLTYDDKESTYLDKIVDLDFHSVVIGAYEQKGREGGPSNMYIRTEPM